MDFGKRSILFPRLDGELLRAVTRYGREVVLPPGAILFAQGAPAIYFYVVLEGEVRVTRRIGEEDALITVHRPGEFTGDLSLLSGGRSLATAHAVTRVRLLQVDTDDLRRMIAAERVLSEIVLPAMALRIPDTEALEVQQERLHALGALAGGLAHELNNPTAAAGRASGQLRSVIGMLRGSVIDCYRQVLSQEGFNEVVAMLDALWGRTAPPVQLDPLARSDSEEIVCTWMEDNHLHEGWTFASTLVSAGIDIAWLDRLAALLPPGLLPTTLRMIDACLEGDSLLDLVDHSTARTAALVEGIKSYSYMDQGPVQDISINAGIESTLVMLGYSLQGVEVCQILAPNLPRLTAHGSELNQVWTKLIENAIEAMRGVDNPVLTIATRLDGERVLAEFTDNGPGIPPEIQSRIFEPFFTTKSLHDRAGLGLNVAYRVVVSRHRGDISLQSRPGQTTFKVWLPITPPPPGEE